MPSRAQCLILCGCCFQSFQASSSRMIIALSAWMKLATAHATTITASTWPTRNMYFPIVLGHSRFLCLVVYIEATSFCWHLLMKSLLFRYTNRGVGGLALSKELGVIQAAHLSPYPAGQTLQLDKYPLASWAGITRPEKGRKARDARTGTSLEARSSLVISILIPCPALSPSFLCRSSCVDLPFF